MMRQHFVFPGAAALLLTMGGMASSAEAAWQTPETGTDVDTLPEAKPPLRGSLVFEREVFEYSRRSRRNPFIPYAVAVTEGPRFEELVLLGIIRHRDDRYSVIVLGSTGPPLDEAAAVTGSGFHSATYRVRIGDVVGRARITEIHDRRVVVEVDEPDGPTRRVLHLTSAAGGNGA